MDGWKQPQYIIYICMKNICNVKMYCFQNLAAKNISVWNDVEIVFIYLNTKHLVVRKGQSPFV